MCFSHFHADRSILIGISRTVAIGRRGPGLSGFGSPERKMSGKYGAVNTAQLKRERSLRARWQGASELSRTNERARITRPCGNTNAVSTNTDSR